MTAMPAALHVPRVRWSIGVLLGAGVLINYFDRINLSVGAPQLQQEFGLTDGELGWLFSGFFWSYALLQIPTGMILDRFGVTSVYRVSAFLLVVRLRRDRVRQRVYRYPRGTLSAGGDRGAGIPGERQGYRLLVSAR